ncbi:MAG: NADH-quinone oxidoreductase subunit J [Actinobacteria bacterium]|nr:NADH-quinone oxidoreductase subunit J [Actinomycetota bacterium]
MSAVILADDIYVAQNIGFGIIAAVMIIGALKVVTSKNVVHAALALVLVLGGAAAQYLLLAAEFVAVTQVLVYVGAVMVLFLFGVMLTRAKLGQEGDLNNKNAILGVPVALLMLGVMSWVLIDGFEDTRLPQDGDQVSVQALSDSIFKPYLLPFWALSFVLLAAVIGAIVLARKD